MNTNKIFSTLAAALLLALPHQASAAIDPATAQKLSTKDAAAFGQPVALSADGSTALIGSDGDGRKGAAYVFTLKNGTWTQQAKLTAPDADDLTQSKPSSSTKTKDATPGSQGGGMGFNAPVSRMMEGGPDGFSNALALSANGSTALIGGVFNDAVYVFTRAPDGSWTQRTKLTGTFNRICISLSADGSTALVGDAYRGEAYVFTRAEDGSWTQQTKLTAAYAAGFGVSASLSGDGGTALIGATGLDNHTGSAYVFTRAADGKWTEPKKLTASDRMIKDMFGFTVSLSGDGNTALIGAYETDKKTGSVYTFRNEDTFLGRIWFQQEKMIVPNIVFDGEGPIGPFNPLSLSADGRIALIGAGNDDGTKGSARVFISTSDGWTRQTNLTAANGIAGEYFGRSVSLSADGSTALISGGGGDGKGGAAYVFTGSAKPIPEQPAPRP